MSKLNTYRAGPDEAGHFGIFGGRYVAETLMPIILEVERAGKRIGSSLEADVEVYADRPYLEALDGIDLAEVAITSGITIGEGKAPEGAYMLDEVPGVAVAISQAGGSKCDRCWRVLEDVGGDPELPEVCGRCADAVKAHLAATV